MKVNLYRYPKSVEWLGWVEDSHKNVIAFISLEGEVVWDW